MVFYRAPNGSCFPFTFIIGFFFLFTDRGGVGGGGGGNRGNYGNFSSEDGGGGRDWSSRGGGGGGNRGNNGGGFGGRQRQERRSFTEDLPNPAPGGNNIKKRILLWGNIIFEQL